MKAVQAIWDELKSNLEISEVDRWVDDWAAQIKSAEARNQIVWKYYRGNPLESRQRYAKSCFRQHYAWLDNLWGQRPLTYSVTVSSNEFGKVLPGGHEFEQVDVLPEQIVVFELVPDDGYAVGRVFLSGVDVTDVVRDNKLELTGIEADCHVEVVFDAASSIDEPLVQDVEFVMDADGLIRSEFDLRVFNVAGRLIGSGNEVQLPVRGVYIVRSSTAVAKLVY